MQKVISRGEPASGNYCPEGQGPTHSVCVTHHTSPVTSTWAYSSPHQTSTNLMSHSSYTCEHFRLWNRLLRMWIWGKGARFTGGLGNAGLTFGLDDTRGLFQNKKLRDSMTHMWMFSFDDLWEEVKNSKLSGGKFWIPVKQNHSEHADCFVLI